MDAPDTQPIEEDQVIQPGNCSVGLAVKDITASKAFYETLGLSKVIGDEQNWVIMRNGAVVVGLFQGMFPQTVMTFNPGRDLNMQQLGSFTDVRGLQKQLKARGIEFATQADETTTGPASFMMADPDGNPHLFDQHV